MTGRDTEVGPRCLNRGSGGRALRGRDPGGCFCVAPRHPAAAEPGRTDHHDFLLDERLRFDLRGRSEPSNHAKFSAV